ncbi:hypothetical protein HKX48_004382 [Thoreauomyces humboldtii]|nr:hypothetical protein HKX48_004382 [Thoreauomyces humboldtii]
MASDHSGFIYEKKKKKYKEKDTDLSVFTPDKGWLVQEGEAETEEWAFKRLKARRFNIDGGKWEYLVAWLPSIDVDKKGRKFGTASGSAPDLYRRLPRSLKTIPPLSPQCGVGPKDFRDQQDRQRIREFSETVDEFETTFHEFCANCEKPLNSIDQQAAARREYLIQDGVLCDPCRTFFRRMKTLPEVDLEAFRIGPPPTRKSARATKQRSPSPEIDFLGGSSSLSGMSFRKSKAAGGSSSTKAAGSSDGKKHVRKKRLEEQEDFVSDFSEEDEPPKPKRRLMKRTTFDDSDDLDSDIHPLQIRLRTKRLSSSIADEREERSPRKKKRSSTAGDEGSSADRRLATGILQGGAERSSKTWRQSPAVLSLSSDAEQSDVPPARLRKGGQKPSPTLSKPVSKQSLLEPSSGSTHHTTATPSVAVRKISPSIRDNSTATPSAAVPKLPASTRDTPAATIRKAARAESTVSIGKDAALKAQSSQPKPGPESSKGSGASGASISQTHLSTKKTATPQAPFSLGSLLSSRQSDRATASASGRRNANPAALDGWTDSPLPSRHKARSSSSENDPESGSESNSDRDSDGSSQGRADTPVSRTATPVSRPIPHQPTREASTSSTGTATKPSSGGFTLASLLGARRDRKPASKVKKKPDSSNNDGDRSFRPPSVSMMDIDEPSTASSPPTLHAEIESILAESGDEDDDFRVLKDEELDPKWVDDVSATMEMLSRMPILEFADNPSTKSASPAPSASNDTRNPPFSNRPPTKKRRILNRGAGVSLPNSRTSSPTKPGSTTTTAPRAPADTTEDRPPSPSVPAIVDAKQFFCRWENCDTFFSSKKELTDHFTTVHL